MGWRWIAVTLLLIPTLLLIAAGSASPVSGEQAALPSDGWSSATLEARTEFALAVVGSRVLVAGGRRSAGAFSDTVDIYDSASGQWSAARLSEARERPIVGIVGGRALFAASNNVRTNSAAVDIYDSGTGQWSTATLSEPRSQVVTATVGSQVLFAGGTVGDALNDSATVDIYDSTTGQWSTATLAKGRKDLATATVGSQVLFAGGTVDGVVSTLVDIYDGATGQWSTATLSKARSGRTAATVGAEALFPTSPYQEPDMVDIYDSTTRQWSAANLAPEGDRHGIAAATVDSLVFFTGNGAADIYDSVSGQWSARPFPEGRTHSGVVAVGNQALFYSANVLATEYKPDGSIVETFDPAVDIYDVASGQWRAGALSLRRSQFGVATVGTQVLFAGGSRGGSNRAARNNLTVVDIYDAESGTWSVGALSLARETPRAVTVGTQVLFIGGLLGCNQCPTSVLGPTVDIYESGLGQGDRLTEIQSGAIRCSREAFDA